MSSTVFERLNVNLFKFKRNSNHRIKKTIKSDSPDSVVGNYASYDQVKLNKTSNKNTT